MPTARGRPRTLSPLDAAFLYFERPTQLLHVGSIALLDGAPPFDPLVEAIARRLAPLSRYRERPVRPFLDWWAPRWEPVPHHDAALHVHHVALPPPGDAATFARLVDDVFATPLPPDRSPWEMILVEGLADGRAAFLCKVHHCMIDGVSGAQVLEVLADPRSAEAPPAAPAPRAARPGPLDRLRSALAAVDLQTLAEIGTTVASFVREPVSTLPFNGALSPARRIAWAGFAMDDFLAVRGAAGCKINDVVLAVVTGALRDYTVRRGLATDGLRARALVPVSVRGADDHLTLGNLVSAVFPRLPLDVADPRERLRRVAAEMSALKARRQAQAAGLMLAAVGALPAPFEALAGRLLPDAPFLSTVCTNVPGPRGRCTLLGHAILEVHPVVPLFQSMGLEFAILSYADRLSITAAADPTLVPDADALPGLLAGSFVSLRDAFGLGRRQTAAPAGPPAGRRVADLMSSPVLTLDPNDTLERAWHLMAEARIRHLPVVGDDGRLAGIVTQRDLLAVAPSRAVIPTEAARVRLLGGIAAREVMETHLAVARADEPAAAAGERMLAAKIGALPVVDGAARLVGILTTDDLVQWATQRLTEAA
jgi:WS/DGAT/MGAT family acyltransferase